MAKGALGSLFVNLSMDAGKFTSGAKQAEDRLDKLSNKFGVSAKQMAKAGAAIGAAMAAATAVVAAAITKIANDFDKLTKQARQIGLPVDQFTSFQVAAEQSGVSMDELARAFRNMARNVAGGSKQFVEALNAIGISFDQFAGLSQQERLLLLAEKFAELRDSGNKTAIAMKILGEEMGPRLISFLNQGRGGLEKYREEAERLGYVVSTDVGTASERLNDALDRLSRKASSFGREVAKEVIPPLADFVEKIVRLIDKLPDLTAVLDKIKSGFQAIAKQISLSNTQLGNFTRGWAALSAVVDMVAPKLAKQTGGTAAQPGPLGATGDLQLPEPDDGLKDAPSIGTDPAAVAAQRTAATEATKAQAEATRQLAESERTLAMLRYEYASPEEQRNIRLEELRKKLVGVSGALKEGTEAHALYEKAAASANARVISAYGGMAASVAGSLSKVFADSKAFAIAQAIIESYVAFNRALANPPGPPFSYAQAAAALASGFAQVRAITSTNKGSRGGGGGAAAAGGGEAAAASNAGVQQAVNVTIQGDRFGREHFRSLIDGLNDAISDGAVITGLKAA